MRPSTVMARSVLKVPAIVLASRLKEASDGSFRPMLPEAVPICQSALGSPSTRISPLEVATLSF